MTNLGTEKLNGETATKYKIESAHKGQDAFSGYAWLNKQNIPLRFEGTASANGSSQDIQIDYSNIAVAKQDPRLFVVPPDYRPMNTGLGGMGSPGKNMSPKQIEQLMKMLKQQQSAN